MLFLRAARYPVFTKSNADKCIRCYGNIVKFIYCKIVRIAFQTELTCQRIQEFESQASSDLELRNNKIDELNRVSMIVIMIINLFKFYYSYVRIKLYEICNLSFSLFLLLSLTSHLIYTGELYIILITL